MTNQTNQVPSRIIESITQTFKEYSSSYATKLEDGLREGISGEIDFINSEINLFKLCLYDLENFDAASEGHHQLDSQTFSALIKSMHHRDYEEFVSSSNKKIAFLKDKVQLLLIEDQKSKAKTIKADDTGKDKVGLLIDPDHPLINNQLETSPFFLLEFRAPLKQILQPYFNSDQQDDLFKLIDEPKKLIPKLTFLGAGNKLADAFKKLIQENIITQCNKKELEEWISKKFNYLNGIQKKEYSIKYLNDIISTQSDKCKAPILKILLNNGGTEKLLQKT